MVTIAQVLFSAQVMKIPIGVEPGIVNQGFELFVMTYISSQSVEIIVIVEVIVNSHASNSVLLFDGPGGLLQDFPASAADQNGIPLCRVFLGKGRA
ncbi:hypothetical protein MED297_18962 [Reinekea sp. MED297]|uniref:Uncharacterized protein n=1 Tax=Reinekea blandensis MED297 TaxID=314283 RepID=A4BKS5_9GAMM|nr:hypothetical protein MED297_18962 [Reinekea sp. MED297] [Reinekea blandensis MED297]